jgi:SAM-dependent methyltransferase
MLVVEHLYPSWRNFRIHESSPVPRGASVKLKRECKDYLETQFTPSLALGVNSGTFRNEDLEHQTFPDGSFDLVITQDVFEHLFNPEQAIKEIARTLRPGGAHICTVPIVRKNKPTVRRATLEMGIITHHLEPEYHGNPIDQNGSLVTVDWGYDITEHMTQASGLLSTLHTLDDISRGISAEYIDVMVNQKPGSRREAGQTSLLSTSVK